MIAGITCCSNGIHPSRRQEVDALVEKLNELGIDAVLSDCVYAKEDVFSGSGIERADALMNLYKDERVDFILDISGGDIANEVLPYLDYDIIKKCDKKFWGYSDLTTIDNAIYAKTGKASVLYQARMLTRTFGEERSQEFLKTVMNEGDDLLKFEHTFIQGDSIDGITVGGNIRCFLKLAGTPYWPNLEGKILVLEAWHGRMPQLTTFFSQLDQMGVFQKIKGVILGTFTQMEEEGYGEDVIRLVQRYVGDKMPIVKSSQIGHGADSRAIEIGAGIQLHRK